MRCRKCYGTGFYMGLGMMIVDCDCNNGTVNVKKHININKRSAEYRDAIKSIMERCGCTRDEAVSTFETEFDKIA